MTSFITALSATDGTLVGASPLGAAPWTSAVWNNYTGAPGFISMTGGVATGDAEAGPKTLVGSGVIVAGGTSGVLEVYGEATLTTGSFATVHALRIDINIGAMNHEFALEYNSPGQWYLVVGAAYSPVSLAPDTAYPLTFVINASSKQMTINGVTVTHTEDYSDFGAQMVQLVMRVGVQSVLSGFTLSDAPPAAPPEVATVDISAPSPVVEAASYNKANVSAAAPSSQVRSYGGASLSILPPTPTLAFTGSPSQNVASCTAPSPTLSAYIGANIKLAAPSPALTASATGTNWGRADVEAPAPTLSASGTVSATVGANLTAPSPNLIGYSGAVISVTLTNSPTVLATGTTGAVGGAQITAPLFELTSTVTAQSYGSANLLAPSPQLGGQAQAWLAAPGATLTAIGTAVVTATYEAYALNLGHTPRRDNQKPTDETTHFTNFPFTHVVRYQNSYFGANSTGLYLLEGTTDNGAPIEWEVKTAYTDLDSAQLKTLEMAYFGGRFGPEATISLYAGEQTTNPYEYTTPRGAAAQNYRQPFGRGQKARYYALGASGDDVVTIDSITLNVATLARKV